MIAKTFERITQRPFLFWGRGKSPAEPFAIYDSFYQPKKRPEYIVKDGKLFDPVSGVYIDLELLTYKREEPTEKTFTISAIDVAFAKKDFGAVLAMTDSILARNPKDIAAMCDKAIALSRSGRVEEALALNTKALAINPNSTAHLNNRAIEYLKLGKPQEALADIEKCLSLRDQKGEKPFIPSYGVLFSAKYAAGDRIGALDALEQGLGIGGGGSIWSLQRESLAKCVGCSTPEEALDKIKQLRNAMGPHVNTAGPSTATSSASTTPASGSPPTRAAPAATAPGVVPA